MRQGTTPSPVSASQGPADVFPRIGYLLSRYPARSHTFFLNEILGLRARGMYLEVASINPPDRPLRDLPPQEASEARSTFYVKGGNRVRTLLSLTSIALRNPGVLLRGLHAIRLLPSLSFSQRTFWLFYLAESLLVGHWMRQRRLSHLHVHFGGPVASVGMLTSTAWRVPYSLTIHGPEELLDPPGNQLAPKIAQASFVICISDFCRGELRRVMEPAAWSKLAVIRLGVDPLLLKPRQASPTLSSALTVVCVGRLVPAKGHNVLLQAVSLLQERGMSLKVVLIGTGPLEAELRSVADHLRLTGSVTFTSGLSHEETLAQLRKADLFALASFAEGVPVALMEAMSLSIPCVSTAVAGIPELIRSGDNGLLVAPGDPTAFADALQALVSDETLRRRLGAAGRRRVLREYNLSLNLDRLTEHMRRCLAESAPASVTPQKKSAGRRS